MTSLPASRFDPNMIKRRTGGDARESGEPFSLTGYSEVAGRLVAGETTGTVIVAGQSNVGNFVNDTYTMTQSRAHMLNVFDGLLYNVKEPVMGANGGLPGSLGFATGNVTAQLVDRLRLAAWRQRVILCNVAAGGTTSTQWASGDCAERVRAACSRVLGWGYTPTVILWHQGENNTGQGIGAAQTTADIRAVKAAFVGYGVTCPMIVCQVAYNGAASVGTPAYLAVRQGQMDAISAPLGIVLGPDTDVYGAAFRQADGLHWNASGRASVSTDMRNAIMGLVP